MTNQVIPLRGGASRSHQTFSAQLGDELYDFELDYLTGVGQWSMRINRNGDLLVAGAMLQPNADIIEPWNLDIGRLIMVGNEPTLDNLGETNSLVWVPPA